MMTLARSIFCLLVVAAISLLAGCDRAPAEGTGQTVKPNGEQATRVVSLAPAITQILVDMKSEKLLVGVAENDLGAPKGLPVVGNYQDLDSEAIIRLKPTHVIMMTGKEGPPQRLTELAGEGIKRLVLFGAATTGELVYQAARRTPVEIAAVVDNDSTKQGTPFGHLVVLAPSAIESFTPDGVLIAAFGRPDEIYQQIKHLKEKGIEIIRL